jgi:hypothetical protein
MIAMVLMVKALLLRLDLRVFSYLVEPHLLVSRRAIRLHVPAIFRRTEPAYRVCRQPCETKGLIAA